MLGLKKYIAAHDMYNVVCYSKYKLYLTSFQVVWLTAHVACETVQRKLVVYVWGGIAPNLRLAANSCIIKKVMSCQSHLNRALGKQCHLQASLVPESCSYLQDCMFHIRGWFHYVTWPAIIASLANVSMSIFQNQVLCFPRYVNMLEEQAQCSESLCC